MDDWESKKARQKESIYRQLYSSVLKRHRGALQGLNDDDDNETTNDNVVFQDEKKLLGQVFQTEVKNLVVGMGAALTVYAALRVGPKYVMQRFGSAQKAKAIRESEEQARKGGTEETQRSIGKKNQVFVGACICTYLTI
jgi:hypothetical protein